MVCGLKNLCSMSRTNFLFLLRADFCASSMQKSTPLLCKPEPAINGRRAIPQPSAAASNVLDPRDAFSLAEPALFDAVDMLRYISSLLSSRNDPKLDKKFISELVYDVEYHLGMFNVVAAPTSLTASEMLHGRLSDTLLHLSLQIYMYIVIRELPAASLLLGTLSSRLCVALNSQVPTAWNAHMPENPLHWYLWMLLLGHHTSSPGTCKQWFLQRLVVVCQAVQLTNTKALQMCLFRVLWREDALCNNLVNEAWGAISACQYVDVEEVV